MDENTAAKATPRKRRRTVWKAFTIRLPEPTAAELLRRADRAGVSPAEYVRQHVERHLGERDPQEVLGPLQEAHEELAAEVRKLARVQRKLAARVTRLLGTIGDLLSRAHVRHAGDEE